MSVNTYFSCETMLLKEWVLINPDVNPFSTCYNIENLGGAELYWEEFKYRYKQREIFDPDEFVNAIKRCFVYNSYKYEKLYETTQVEYNMLHNYLVEKVGQEQNTLNLSKQKTGTDTVTPNITITETPAVTTTKTETPTTSLQETTTPNLTEATTKTPRVETTTTETPRVKVRETETPRVSTTTTTSPANYTDAMSKTTFDSDTFNPVQTTTRTYDANHPETVITTPTDGTNIKLTEPTEGTNTTVVSQNGTETTNTTKTGSQTKTSTYTSGNVQTITSQTGNNTERKTGTESTQYNTNVSDTGTETLAYLNRKDQGYMYRPPQDAIEDERKVAIFSLLDIILSDIEQATLISIYN